ncbi:hypothetical protein, partial [Plasmodium yoelii yoelii]
VNGSILYGFIFPMNWEMMETINFYIIIKI